VPFGKELEFNMHHVGITENYSKTRKVIPEKEQILIWEVVAVEKYDYQ
jgi:hypothetical protein